MCGKKRQRVVNQYGESYEGETTQLRAFVRQERRSAWHAFPWWTLWLIWPLMGLLKGASGALVAGWLALGTFAVPLNMLLAVGLIIVGVALLVRQRT